jgi:hypothetical protein
LLFGREAYRHLATTLGYTTLNDQDSGTERAAARMPLRIQLSRWFIFGERLSLKVGC